MSTADRTWDGETCGRCGGEVAATTGDSYWRADDLLWNQVEGSDPAIIRCIPCFTLDARETGIPISWRPVVEKDARWINEMPVLAGILRDGPPRCCLSSHSGGHVVRETEWGTLWLCGDHYTLIERRP